MFCCSAWKTLSQLSNWKEDVTMRFSGRATLHAVGVPGTGLTCCPRHSLVHHPWLPHVQKNYSFPKWPVLFPTRQIKTTWLWSSIEQLSQTCRSNTQHISHCLFFPPNDSAELLEKQLCCLQKLPFPIHLNLSSLFHLGSFWAVTITAMFYVLQPAVFIFLPRLGIYILALIF